MCHSEPPSVFPRTEPVERIDDGIVAWRFQAEQDVGRRVVAVLPDIYGCNPFYRGFSAYLAAAGVEAWLVDPFAALGELITVSREAAFDRRHQLKDRAYLDLLEAFLVRHGVGGVVGFCLGGLFVFELARRGLRSDLVAYYPFPQGLPNQDPLPVPFTYLETLSSSHTVLIGDQDNLLGPTHLGELERLAGLNPAIRLQVYSGSGHGFLADLDSPQSLLAGNAARSLEVCRFTLMQGT